MELRGRGIVDRLAEEVEDKVFIDTLLISTYRLSLNIKAGSNRCITTRKVLPSQGHLKNNSAGHKRLKSHLKYDFGEKTTVFETKMDKEHRQNLCILYRSDMPSHGIIALPS